MIASTSKRGYTLADYLAVEEMSVVRHEYLDGEIFAMAGGTPEHAALAAAIVVTLGKTLGSDGRAYSADLRLRVEATGSPRTPTLAWFVERSRETRRRPPTSRIRPWSSRC